MSRSTVSKSRADKTKDRESKGATSATAPQTSTDVVPGRFTEQDWNLITEREDGEHAIFDIVTEIVDSAIDVIYDDYIQKQLFPYIVDQSRAQFLHIIEWQFLARDEGGPSPTEDSTWAEEEEPLPSTPDAWAQGLVPHQRLPPSSPTISEHDTEVTSMSRISNPEILEDAPSTINESVYDTAEEEEGSVQEAETTAVEEPERIDDSSIMGDEDIPSPPKPRKAKYKPHRGPLKSAGVRKMYQTLEDTEKELISSEKIKDPPAMKSALDYLPSSCHNILKVQSGRPPGSKDVTYDDLGNVISVLKLDPEKLPAHRVRTKFTVVDPAVEAAEARLQAMRTGRNYKNKQITKQNRSQETRDNGHMTRGKEPPTYSSSEAGKLPERGEELITPLHPPLIETMKLSPGVTVRGSGRFKQGQMLSMRTGDLTGAAPGNIQSLKPLKILDSKGVTLSVGDIIGRRSPSVRPLSVSEPIPPIIPRHPSSRDATPVEG